MAANKPNPVSQARHQAVPDEYDMESVSDDEDAAPRAHISDDAGSRTEMISAVPKSASSTAASSGARLVPGTTAAPQSSSTSTATMRNDPGAEPEPDKKAGSAAARSEAAVREDSLHLQRSAAADQGKLQAYEEAAGADPGLKNKAGFKQAFSAADANREMDFAIQAGSTIWTQKLRKLGAASSLWPNVDKKLLLALPQLYRARDEASLLKTLKDSKIDLQQLARAGTAYAALRLGIRSESESLVREWAQAHPKCLQETMTPVMRGHTSLEENTALIHPIKAGSLKIARLLLELGVKPHRIDIQQADGEIKALLEKAYAALPENERY